jgi:hypothetical protein
VSGTRRKAASVRALVAEIVRRSGESSVVRLSDPPSAAERLQLLAARLQGRPVAIVPASYATVEEWLRRYAEPARRRT